MIKADLREQLSNLQGLLMLSMLMTQSGDPQKILHLAETSVPSFGRCHIVGAKVDDRWLPAASAKLSPEHQVDLAVQLSALPASGGDLEIPGRGWVKALPLRTLHSQVGYLVVGAAEPPTANEQFLLQVLAQQTGIALVNERLHAKERATAEQLQGANETLASTVSALERTTEIHVRFTRVAAAGEGQEGIARALHELTGFPVAIEDRYGNLRAWAGPNRPEPYPKDPQAKREQMLRRALREGAPVREAGRLIAIASPAADVFGVLALTTPLNRPVSRNRSPSNTVQPCWPWNWLACAAWLRPSSASDVTWWTSSSAALRSRAPLPGRRHWDTTWRSRIASWSSKATGASTTAKRSSSPYDESHASFTPEPSSSPEESRSSSCPRPNLTGRSSADS
jgi:hypothetical protein